jgi:hypothetical protein
MRSYFYTKKGKKLWKLFKGRPKEGIYNHSGRIMTPEYVAIRNTGNLAAGAGAKANAQHTASGGIGRAEDAENDKKVIDI